MIIGLREPGISIREIGNRISSRTASTAFRVWNNWTTEQRQLRYRNTGGCPKDYMPLMIKCPYDSGATMVDYYRKTTISLLQNDVFWLIVLSTESHLAIEIVVVWTTCSRGSGMEQNCIQCESRFCLYIHVWRRRVRQTRGERREMRFCIEHKPALIPWVMVRVQFHMKTSFHDYSLKETWILGTISIF